MTAPRFVDTNILLYSIDEDPSAQAKRARAIDLLADEAWCWSVQVAAEFYVNATHPKRPFRLDIDTARHLLDSWFRCPTQEMTPELLKQAISIQQRYRINYWDASIIAAASRMGCSTLYSEDLNPGQTYDGVTVVNPSLT